MLGAPPDPGGGTQHPPGGPHRLGKKKNCSKHKAPRPLRALPVSNYFQHWEFPEPDADPVCTMTLAGLLRAFAWALLGFVFLHPSPAPWGCCAT